MNRSSQVHFLRHLILQSTALNDDGTHLSTTVSFNTGTEFFTFVNNEVIDLSLTKTVNGSTPNLNDTLVYTITLTNSGPYSAERITVQEMAPSELTLVISVPSQGIYDGTNWNVGILNNGSAASLVLTGTVNSVATSTNISEVMSVDELDIDSLPSDGIGDDFAMTVVTPLQADLALSKGVNDPTLNINDTIIYTLNLINNGPGHANNIVIQDSIPTVLTNVTIDVDQGTFIGGTWTVGDINNGNTATLMITGTVHNSVTFTNIAEVISTDQFDPDSTPSNSVPAEDDQDEAIVTSQQADLSLTKTVNNPAPKINDTIIYTVTVLNSGPNSANSVAAQENLPSELINVTSGVSQGSFAGSSWIIGTLNNGSSATLTITGTVNSGSAFTNTAQVALVTQSDPDSTPNNNVAAEDDQDEAIVAPLQADLPLTKTVNNSAPNVNDTIVYTVTITNSRSADVAQVFVEETVPSELINISSTVSQGFFVNPTWEVGTITNGGSAILTLTGTVNSANTFTNIAQVTRADQFDPDSTPNDGTGDDYTFVSIMPRQADLALTKTVNNSSPNINDTIVFSLILTNSGPNTANNIVVTDNLPLELSNTTSSTLQGSFDGTNWSIPTLSTNAAAALTITGIAISANAFTNAAEVTAVDEFDPDSTPGNEMEDDYDTQVIVSDQTDLQIIKTMNPTNPVVGNTVTFTLTVTNLGPEASLNVSVVDIMQSRYAYVSNSISGGDSNTQTDPTGSGLTWTLTNLSAGASRTLSFNALVQPSGNETNTATLTSSTFDLNTANNTDTVLPSTIIAAADLQLFRSMSPTNPIVGSNVTFTIIVSNAGPNTATTLSIADNIPNEYTYIPGSITGSDSPDATFPPALSWMINTLTNGQVEVLGFQATVQAQGNYTNTVTASLPLSIIDPNANGAPTIVPSDVIPVADVAVLKSISPAQPIVGSDATFTITVTNADLSTAAGILVSDMVLDGYTYNVGSIMGGDTPLLWTLNTLPANISTQLTFMATINPIGNYTNTTTVTSQTLDLNTTNNSSTIDISDNLEKGVIGNFAWNDLNLNEIQDPGEPGLQNVLVRLYKISSGVTNEVAIPLATSASGLYTFTGVSQGSNYMVGFGLLPQFRFSSGDQGSDDTLDSDVIAIDTTNALGFTAPFSN
ncbi:MAG: DUF11 domain-containing protein [Kiritimatiellae bacterium]|nr:DUF11 domain-containing protein [Kiritimatiellia bacterium]